MKIQAGTGAAIWLANRHDGDGLIVRQGSSRLVISDIETQLLLDAIKKLRGEPHIQRFATNSD